MNTPSQSCGRSRADTAADDVHLSGYQARDWDVVDYRMGPLGDTGLWFRGGSDVDLSAREYFTCLGAAQTFGCFCEHPYPTLLSDALGLKALNLGYGGAGPEFFVRQMPRLQSFINAGKFVIVQVMSGRSQSNSLFECDGLELLTVRRTKQKLGASAAYEQLLAGPAFAARLRPKLLGKLLGRMLAAPQVLRLVEQTRRNWISSYHELLGGITVPVILFWFSKRKPSYSASVKNIHTLLGEFPHLINSRTLKQIKPGFTDYVECITDRGSPQPLFSRFSGQATSVDPAADRADLASKTVWTHNAYYPSPEMQEDAAQILLTTCQRLLG